MSLKPNYTYLLTTLPEELKSFLSINDRLKQKLFQTYEELSKSIDEVYGKATEMYGFDVHFDINNLLTIEVAKRSKEVIHKF